MNAKLQHAGVVFLRTFVAIGSALAVTFSAHYAKDIGAAAIAGAFAGLADLIAHRP